MSGLGGVGKTELSVSVVEKLGLVRYVLWLRASDHELLQQDLVTSAEDLRNELLRFELGPSLAGGASPFYFSGVTVTDLVNLLKRWLKATPDDGSRILVVLDDLDGLDLSYQKQYSAVFSGDALDLIYSTRDPSMADPGMFWEAVKFDVPPLQMDDATDLLKNFSKDNRPAQARGIIGSIQHISSLRRDDSDKAKMRDVATRLGALPAAITIGSHYIKDNFGLRWSPDSYENFLSSWDQDYDRGHILKSHRAMLQYGHSMLASFEVSLDRLRRNARNAVWRDTHRDLCLDLLQLLSAMDLHEITRNDLSELERVLRTGLPDLRNTGSWIAMFGYSVPRPGSPEYELSIDQRVTELVKVSLLTKRSTDGILLLNNVVKACALLVPTSISSAKRNIIEHIAKEVTEHWKRREQL